MRSEIREHYSNDVDNVGNTGGKLPMEEMVKWGIRSLLTFNRVYFSVTKRF